MIAVIVSDVIVSDVIVSDTLRGLAFACLFLPFNALLEHDKTYSKTYRRPER